MDGIGGMDYVRDVPAAIIIVGGLSRRRQANEVATMQFEEIGSTRHIPEGTVGGAPIPASRQFLGNLPSTPTGMVVNQLADGMNIFRGTSRRFGIGHDIHGQYNVMGMTQIPVAFEEIPILSEERTGMGSNFSCSPGGRRMAAASVPLTRMRAIVKAYVTY